MRGCLRMKRKGRPASLCPRPRYRGAGRLRQILSGYLTNANRIRFTYSPAGKPGLEPGPETADIQFNLAHSRRRAVYAVTRNRRVGVDLEYRDLRAARTIADGFFAPAEKAGYDRLPPEVRETAFFLWWTRKEAFLKALGGGLSIPLDQFEVSLAPGEPAALHGTGWDLAEAERWRLVDLEVERDYAGAGRGRPRLGIDLSERAG